MSFSVLMALVINSSVWVACVIWIIFLRRAPIYHPITFILIYHFLGFVIRPFLIFSQNGSDVWYRVGIVPDDWIIIYTAIISSLALLALWFGISRASLKSSMMPKIMPANIVVANPIRYYVAIFIFCSLGVYGLIQAYGGAGLDNVQAFDVEYDSAGGQRLVGISGYVLALGEFLPVICILLFMDKSRRKFAILLIAMYVAVRFYIGAQRLSFVVVLIGVYLFTLINAGKKYPSIKVVAFALVFAVIFDVIGGDRYAFRKLVMGEETISGVVSNYIDVRSKTPLVNDLAEFDVASAALQVVPDRTGWSYGSQYLRLLIWPIPRQLWNDKPVYTSLVDLNQYGYFLAMTHTLYIDAYMVFGLIPMLMILAGFGYYLGRLYERARCTNSMIWFMTFWVQLMYIKTLLRDGGVTAFYFLLISIACVFILAKVGDLRLDRNEI